MKLAYDVVGSGSPIVLIHGITESRVSWQPLIGPLSQHHQVVAVDLRGHGESPHADSYDPISLATDVVEALDAIGVDRPLVIGHSLGGIVATAFAVVGTPRGVINVDQPLKLSDFKAQRELLEPMLRGDTASFQEAIAIVFDLMKGQLDPREDARLNSLRRADQDVVLGIWGTIFDSTPEQLDATVDALASGVRVPYLSLHGIDPGPDYEAWLTKRVPTATVELWPDLGHYPHLVRTAEFLTRVETFDNQ